jgi:hypothetical protein
MVQMLWFQNLLQSHFGSSTVNGIYGYGFMRRLRRDTAWYDIVIGGSMSYFKFKKESNSLGIRQSSQMYFLCSDT